MAGRHYFLITSLPPLPELGSAPPLTAAQLLAGVGEAGAARALVETLFLGDDLLQREALLAGQIDQAEPTVLRPAQLRDEEPLPACLIREDAEAAAVRVPADAVWSAYYHHAADVAERRASGFLAAWVRQEVALRNAVAAARAKDLGLEVEPYLVASDLGRDADDLTGVVSEWAAAPDPLAGLRALDNARWTWLAEHDQWFSFGDDELAAYAAKLMLLHRWHRLTEAAAAKPGERTQP
jgi:hypothetical protein